MSSSKGTIPKAAKSIYNLPIFDLKKLILVTEQSIAGSDPSLRGRRTMPRKKTTIPIRNRRACASQHSKIGKRSRAGTSNGKKAAPSHHQKSAQKHRSLF